MFSQRSVWENDGRKVECACVIVLQGQEREEKTLFVKLHHEETRSGSVKINMADA